MTTFKDVHGDHLVIERSTKTAGVFIDSNAAHMPREQVPAILDAIREAAGLPKPVEHKHTDAEGDSLRIHPSADLPDVVRKLYEAAGQPAPIILDRPSPDVVRSEGWISGPEVEIKDKSQYFHPDDARSLAATLAAAADLIEADATEADVKALANAIISTGVNPELAEKAARAAVAAGFARAAE
ncbi:hypothetical protein HII36_43025 [Nonomuraea sp. NN258]|uniref:hypothetical protein n=1 Tax=Nonomuraea antri TaxID=2730852 RepID=UPI001569965F|nr:hypothetical protein [Nonomuraea antri]NRQ38552.1 hypothetical protein [Nonomuraea antri]